MINILIIWIGEILAAEENLIKYLIEQGKNANIDFGLLTYENINDALDDRHIIENDIYSYYLVFGEDKFKLERQLPIQKLLGFSLGENWDFYNKNVIVICSKPIEYYQKLFQVAAEGDCASVLFINANAQPHLYSKYDSDFWRADIIIDEDNILDYKEKGIFIIDKIKKENSYENQTN